MSVEYRTYYAPLSESIGSRLRRSRVERGWTQADLAERLGITPRTVLSWERSRYPLPTAAIFNAADVLNIDPRWLWDGRRAS